MLSRRIIKTYNEVDGKERNADYTKQILDENGRVVMMNNELYEYNNYGDLQCIFNTHTEETTYWAKWIRPSELSSAFNSDLLCEDIESFRIYKILTYSGEKETTDTEAYQLYYDYGDVFDRKKSIFIIVSPDGHNATITTKLSFRITTRRILDEKIEQVEIDPSFSSRTAKLIESNFKVTLHGMDELVLSSSHTYFENREDGEFEITIDTGIGTKSAKNRTICYNTITTTHNVANGVEDYSYGAETVTYDEKFRIIKRKIVEYKGTELEKTKVEEYDYA